MKLLRGDHVAELAVFIGLARLEAFATRHTDRRMKSLLKT